MTDVNQIVQQIRADLRGQADAATLASGQRYFKGGALAYGVKTAAVNAVGRQSVKAAKAAGLSKADVYRLCDDLWASGYLEEAFVACVLSESQSKATEPADFDVFDGWVRRHVTNWATCDTLCNHTVGDLMMRFPELGERLLAWATTDQRWVKRASAVSLIVPARRGMFHPLAFRIADALLTDPDDMVQKGYGWLLKAAAESDQAAVLSYVMARKATMPRTALRYAIEKMPPDLKRQAMAR